MAKDNVRMPSSGAGITTFYEESKSKFHIPPYTILGIIILIIVVTIVLNSL